MIWQKAWCGGDACSAVTEPSVVTEEAEGSERRAVPGSTFFKFVFFLLE